MSSRFIVSPGARFDSLQRAEASLERRTDLKIQSGCGHTVNELVDAQTIVFPSYGMEGPVSDPKKRKRMQELLFRWLLAHTGDTVNDFHVNTNNSQWKVIMKHYFSTNGTYAELALAERILLSDLRRKAKLFQTDIFPMDRLGDRDMASDLMMHRHLPEGRFHLGVQVGTSNAINRKIHTLLNRKSEDIQFFQKNPSQNVEQFLRHTSCVVMFPLFHPSDTVRNQGSLSLLSGKRNYQSKFLRDAMTDFSQYGNWVIEMMDCLHQGIVERHIQPVSKGIHGMSYVVTTQSGHSITVYFETIQKRQFVKMEYRIGKIGTKQRKPIMLAFPLDKNSLDIYRDMAGVRAQS